jgi:hypothetical protein
MLLGILPALAEGDAALQLRARRHQLHLNAPPQPPRGEEGGSEAPTITLSVKEGLRAPGSFLMEGPTALGSALREGMAAAGSPVREGSTAEGSALGQGMAAAGGSVREKAAATGSEVPVAHIDRVKARRLLLALLALKPAPAHLPERVGESEDKAV